jgi:hypothetical protein
MEAMFSCRTAAAGRTDGRGADAIPSDVSGHSRQRQTPAFIHPHASVSKKRDG